MAIVATEPREDLNRANSVLVYSDAAMNDAAIREIDAWARERGFVRTHEYNLSQVLREGQRYYKGFCYRLTEEDVKAAEEDIRRFNKRREEMPMTTDSAELLRESR